MEGISNIFFSGFNRFQDVCSCDVSLMIDCASYHLVLCWREDGTFECASVQVEEETWGYSFHESDRFRQHFPGILESAKILGEICA